MDVFSLQSVRVCLNPTAPSSQSSGLSRKIARGVMAAALALAAAQAAVADEKVLRIAMTAADIPRTLGQPDQGFEGNRFTGIPMYDALTHWDLSKADAPSVLIPGLATSWSVGAQDKTKWTFKLRSGVKFHDGSAFDADAVVWNVQKVLEKDALHFDASQVGVTASRMPTLRSARKIDAPAALAPAAAGAEVGAGLAAGSAAGLGANTAPGTADGGAIPRPTSRGRIRNRRSRFWEVTERVENKGPTTGRLPSRGTFCTALMAWSVL
jgi:ABC-type transport system substrate-binding protein